MLAISSASATTTLADLRLAAQLPDRAPLAQRHDVEREHVARHDRLAELRLVDGHEVDDVRLRVEPDQVGGEQRPGLGERLDDEHARHHRMAREVAVEVGLVPADELAGDDAVRADLVDPVDEQERVAVREDPLDGADVEHVVTSSGLGAAGAAAAGAAALAVGALARVVAADELVGQIEVGLGEHERRLVEDHAEVLGGGDLADDAGHALEDLGGRLLLLGRQVLLVAQVGLLDLLHARLQLGLLLADLVGGEQRALLVEILDVLLERGLLLVELLLLLIEDLLEVGLRLAAVLGLVERALHVDVPELHLLGERREPPSRRIA